MKKKRSWKKVHKSSGATVFERSARSGGGGSCKLTAIPSDWTRPSGASVWSTTCGGTHKRGNSSSLKNAKKAASRAAKKMGR